MADINPHVNVQNFLEEGKIGYTLLLDFRRKVEAALAEVSSPLPLDHVVQALWAQTHGIVSLLIVNPDFPWMDRDELMNTSMDIAMKGLRPYRIEYGGEKQNQDETFPDMLVALGISPKSVLLRDIGQIVRRTIMPVADYQTYCKMLNRARKESFAYPAINVTSLSTANAVLAGVAESRSDGIHPGLHRRQCPWRLQTAASLFSNLLVGGYT